jgi:adenylate kinase
MQAKFNLPITSPGAMLREERRLHTPLGLEAEKLTSQGRLLPDETIVALVRAWLSQHGSQFIFDGFPRSVGQADALETMLSERGAPLDAAFALEAPLAVLEKRVAGRLVCLQCGQIVGAGLHVEGPGSPCPRCGGALGRRSDDTAETLRIRLEEYREKTEPLLGYYLQRGLLQRVDGAASPDEVFKSMAVMLES